ncbi:hypothetical protein FQA39_LY02789 [Lamprigera yunnana]|nr:hypothetical protein FQA39_LY02789 [Lamprigera yunnana]
MARSDNDVSEIQDGGMSTLIVKMVRKIEEDDVAETTSADIGDCDLWVPEDEKEDEENEEEDEENVENKISNSEIEASGNSRRTDKAISNLKCKKSRLSKISNRYTYGLSNDVSALVFVPQRIEKEVGRIENHP